MSQRINEQTQRVVILISNYRIEGDIFLQNDKRLTDFINVPKQFLALKNAKIYRLDEDEPVYNLEFLDLNKNHIMAIFCMPHFGQPATGEIDEG